MKGQMIIKDLIIKYANANGFDGLFNDRSECACLIEDSNFGS